MYNVKKHCHRGEVFLEAMGFQQKPGTSEMLYAGIAGTAAVDTMKVAGTVVDLLVIVEMLDTLLKLQKDFKQAGMVHDVETVFKDEFQEPLASAGTVRNMSNTSAQSEGVAAGGCCEEPPAATARQQGASQQWMERGMSSQLLAGPTSSPHRPVGGREETSTDSLLRDLPRLYPKAPPTAKSVAQPRASTTPAVQVHVQQPSMQAVSKPQDMYGDYDYGMHVEKPPQLGQHQKLPTSPRAQHSVSHVHQGAPRGSSTITHIPGYEVDSCAAQPQASHLSRTAAHGKSQMGVPSHPLSRSRASASSGPVFQQGIMRQQHKVFSPPRASTGGAQTAAPGRVDMVKVTYHDDGRADVSPVGHRERDYYNADVIDQSLVSSRRHSHELPARKSPVPSPRRKLTPQSEPSEPQTMLHHSLTPTVRPPQYAHSLPPATAGYQSLGPTLEDEGSYARPVRPAINVYQSLGPTKPSPYACLLPTAADRDPPMDQHCSHPRNTGSSGVGRHVVREESSSHRVQQRRLPDVPHSSREYYNVDSCGEVASRLRNPHVHVPTSKHGQQYFAVERHHCNDSSGSGGQNSGEEYSKHGPSSDEEHSLPQVTRL